MLTPDAACVWIYHVPSSACPDIARGSRCEAYLGAKATGLVTVPEPGLVEERLRREKEGSEGVRQQADQRRERAERLSGLAERP